MWTKLEKKRLKLERRLVLTGRDAIKISIFSIIATLVIFGILLIWAGVNPIEAYRQIFSYAYDPRFGLGLTIRSGMFLLFATLAFILPLRAGIWNIGVEGQFYLGTVGAFWVAYTLSDLPSGALIPLMLIVGALFGAGFGAITGYLKGKLNVNEIVLAIMLNNIAYWLIHFLIVGGPWMGAAESVSRPLPVSAWAPMIWEVPSTTFLVLAISVLLYLVLSKFAAGYQIRTLGSSSAAAKYAGMSPLKISLFVMVVGGAIAGLAAYHLWAGDPGFHMIPKPQTYKHQGNLTYYGIVCGLLCVLNPLAAIPTAIFISGITVGSSALIRRLGLGFGIDFTLLGILFLTLAAFQFFYQYRIARGKKEGEVI